MLLHYLDKYCVTYVSEHSSGENMCSKGGYILKKTFTMPQVSLIASGSEFEIALEAQKKLKDDNIESQVISVPSYDIFETKVKSYKNEILGREYS